MLTPKEIEQLEYTLINEYLDELRAKKYSSEVIRGDVQEWTDADTYWTFPGSCTVSGVTIKKWLIDNFDSLIDGFLRESGGVRNISDLATDADLVDAATYSDFVYDKLDDIEEYFWSSDIFASLKDEYFEENAERDY